VNPEGHWHRRGKPTEGRGAWEKWKRYPCTEKGCDWAVYVSPVRREWVGYVAGVRPGNVIDPADVPAVAQRRRVVVGIGVVDTLTGEIDDT
jgi:hypothetical protein